MFANLIEDLYLEHTHTQHISYKISYILANNVIYILSILYLIYISYCTSYICVYDRGLIYGVYCFKLLLLNNDKAGSQLKIGGKFK